MEGNIKSITVKVLGELKVADKSKKTYFFITTTEGEEYTCWSPSIHKDLEINPNRTIRWKPPSKAGYRPLITEIISPEEVDKAVEQRTLAKEAIEPPKLSLSTSSSIESQTAYKGLVDLCKTLLELSLIERNNPLVLKVLAWGLLKMNPPLEGTDEYSWAKEIVKEAQPEKAEPEAPEPKSTPVKDETSAVVPEEETLPPLKNAGEFLTRCNKLAKERGVKISREQIEGQLNVKISEIENLDASWIAIKPFIEDIKK